VLRMRNPMVPTDKLERLPRISIAEALRSHWFEIWYQPKVDLKRKCLAGAEALARIRHPELGVLLPGGFVPKVSANDIAELAQHTVQTALADWALFDAAGFNLHLAVNMPGRLLPDLAVSALAGNCRASAEHWPGLVLEVTEPQLVAVAERFDLSVGAMRENRLAIAIDDFGAEPALQSALQELPIAALKIAPRFVHDCAVDAAHQETCKAAIELAHHHGWAAVADGVASPVDMQALMAMGCDFAQGPLIAPFLPASDLLDLLRLRNAPPPAAPKDVIGADANRISRVA
jgi:EAL domain-containing protein (putative c-di-GMP-specific phosphodiesterase class I)